MSLLNKLEKNMNVNFDKFLDSIVETYGVDKSELLELAKQFEVKKEVKKETSMPEGELNPVELVKKTVVELKALCKERGHKVSGKKEELVSRLLGKTVDLPKTEKKERKTKEKTETKFSKPLMHKIKEAKEQLVIRKNNFGNFMHLESGLVLDKDTHVAKGKQNEDGTISELTDEDIENARLFGIKYELPKNLDKDNLEQEKVDELEELEKEGDDEELEDDDEDSELLDE